MKTLFVAGLLAFLGALLITSTFKPKPLEAQLLHLQVKQTLPEMADELAAEPAQIQALFLAYAEDPVLLAKAKIALLRYPEIARPLLLTYGGSPDFQAVLSRYGEDALLPLQYFVTHEVFTIEFMRKISETTQKALGLFGQSGDEPSSGSSGDSGEMSSEERGWYAIQFIKTEGYDFIGQFVLAPNGKVGWVQTERVLEGINSFFAGGVKGLETRVRRDEPISVGDVGWAALDVAIGVSAFKILRKGKAGAVSGRTLTFSQRSAALGSGLWRTSAIGMRLVKYGAPAVLAYIAIRHPSVINSLLGSVAEKLGLPPSLVQVIGWTLVLLPVLLLLRLLLRPLAWAVAAFLGLLRSADNLMRKREARA
ncbi:hypothetical protein H0A71_16740 [Alcaligenaceae bacterium]|nr:hypothetical protein [Alcaligenaceae bacterium]